MPETKTKIDEKKQAAASYILTFYNQIIVLNDTYSKFLNMLVELDTKYGSEFEKKAIDEEKNALIEASRSLRYVATNAYIQYKVLCESVEKLNSTDDIKKTSEQYLTIRDKVIPNREHIEIYVITLNKFLVSNIMQEILTSSSEFIDKITN